MFRRNAEKRLALLIFDRFESSADRLCQILLCDKIAKVNLTEPFSIYKANIGATAERANAVGPEEANAFGPLIRTNIRHERTVDWMPRISRSQTFGRLNSTYVRQWKKIRQLITNDPDFLMPLAVYSTFLLDETSRRHLTEVACWNQCLRTKALKSSLLQAISREQLRKDPVPQASICKRSLFFHERHPKCEWRLQQIEH